MIRTASAALLLAALSVPSAASPRGDCYYDRGEFTVVHEGRVLRTSTDRYAAALVECSEGVSAVYDGDDLIVFDPRSGSFKTHGVDDAYAGARLAVSRDLAVLYDGDDFIVYDARAGRFVTQWADDGVAVAEVAAGRDGLLAWDGDDLAAYCPAKGSWTTSWDPRDGERATPVRERGGGVAMRIGGKRYGLDPAACRIGEDAAGRGLVCDYDGDDFIVFYEGTRYSASADDDFPHARWSCGRNAAVLYDGDDLIVFDGRNRSFQTHSADDGEAGALAIAGDDAVLAYDGDDAVAWCRGRWLTEGADDRAPARAGGSRWGRWMSMSVGNDIITLDTQDCRLESR